MMMRRLQGVDSYLWYNETPTNHMHTLKIAVLDTAASPIPYSAEKFTRILGERLHLLPSFRWRLQETPLALHHPVWAEDPAFDITRHVFRVTADAPGGPQQLHDCIGRIAETPLRRDRPLWEVHLVEGLANGQVAAVAKIHHAMADGGAAANQLLNVTDAVSSALPASSPQPWCPAPPPSRPRLMLSALQAHPRQARGLPGLLAKTWRGHRAAARYWHEHRAWRARPWSAPRAFTNGTIDARRRFATTSTPLSAVQALRRGTNYTINDIVLAVVTEALRQILLARHETPSAPLIANVPADSGLRRDRLFGNSVGLLFTALPVELPDRRQRLQHIHDGVRIARNARELLGPELLDEWLEYIPPSLFARLARLNARSKLLAKLPPMMNVVVSNVRGSSTRLSLGGYPIANVYSVGPLDVGMALNITVWSYADRLNFSVLTCPRQIPDPHIVTDALQRAFTGLEDAGLSSRGQALLDISEARAS